MASEDLFTVVVTGGAQGIGKGLTSHFLSCGWRVAAFDNDEEAGKELLVESGAVAGRLRFFHADVSEEEQVIQAIRATLQWSSGRLDGLVNNAGIGGAWKSLEETSLADWNRVLAVNLTGGFLVARHAAGALRDSHGAIVNIASTRALMSEPNSFAYSASKGGITSLTHSLAVSLGPQVRVNCISPGWIECGPWKKSSTRTVPAHSEADCTQHPCGRIGTPEDVAALAAWLLSPAAGFITGQNFVVDGGMTKKMIYA